MAVLVGADMVPALVWVEVRPLWAGGRWEHRDGPGPPRKTPTPRRRLPTGGVSTSSLEGLGP